MQSLKIPYIAEIKDVSSVYNRAALQSAGVEIAVSVCNWPDYLYSPEVKVFAGHTRNHLWLLYEVKSDHYRLKAFIDQEAVWEDSCVEFFVSSGNQADAEYWNFEFNALGTCLSAYGTKSYREFLPETSTKQILRFSSLNGSRLPAEGDLFDWSLVVAIPLNLIGLKKGKPFWGNFYKCGDETKIPHFLSWKGIKSGSPDFHLPQFFGEMILLA
jgi:hypothetical protein